MSVRAVARAARRRTGGDGAEGNARLTAVNGALLVVLLALEGITILAIRQLITLHVFIGLLLVGPLLLKIASTGYRFVRYYTGSTPYVRKGPPHPILRILGPIVLGSSLAVLGTGIGLAFTDPGNAEPLLTLHQGSFVVWFAATAIHVLGHALGAGRTTWRELHDPGSTPAARGRRWRMVAIGAALIVGVGFATAVTPAAHAWTAGRAHEVDDSSAAPAAVVSAAPSGSVTLSAR